MAADFNFLSGQTNGGRKIDITSNTTVHTVPSGEKHEITIIARSAGPAVVDVTIDGESTSGPGEAIPANEMRVIFTGVVVGDGSTSIVAVNANGADAVCWGKIIKLA